MLKLYTTPSCASCRKAKKWLNEHHVEFEEKNIFAYPLTRDDLRYMLKNTENGFEDIISTRSKYFVDNKIDIDSMKVSELEKVIIENPSILRRPIIVSDDKMQVGYNDDDIRVFVPREIRKRFMCTNCSNCDYQKALKRCFEEEVKKNS